MVELREKERATDNYLCPFVHVHSILHVCYMCTCILHVCMYITCTHVYYMLYPIGLFMFARGLAVFCQTRPRRNPTEMSNA